MAGVTFMKSECTTSRGKGPMSQIANANLSVAVAEKRCRRAQTKTKTEQVRKGNRLAQRMAFVSPCPPANRQISGCLSYRLYSQSPIKSQSVNDDTTPEVKTASA